MAPSLDILDILPSTSEESVSRRANELVPKCLLYPVPSFDELRHGNFYIWQNNTKISSIEATRQLLGNQLYNHIDGHPLREYIQSRLEEYQNSFVLPNIAKEIENQLPKENRLDPLGKDQLIKLLETLAKTCIPEWAFSSIERHDLSNRLSTAIATAKDWTKIIKSTDDNFAYAALLNFVEQTRSSKPSKLNIVTDTGNIFRNVLLKAVSRCLGPFFIRCLIYIFRRFTSPQFEKNFCRWSINMGQLQSYTKGGLMSPSHSTFSGNLSRPGHISGRASSIEEPFRSPANFPSPRPGALPNFASPSRPAAVGNRTTSLEGERPATSGGSTPRPGAVVNRSKASSVDVPPPGPPLRFPPKKTNPNLVEVTAQSTPTRKRPPTAIPSPVQPNLASELSSPPPHQNEPSIPRAPGKGRPEPVETLTPASNPEGEPPNKKKKQPGCLERPELVAHLMARNKSKAEEIVRLNRCLASKAEEKKNLIGLKEKAEAEAMELVEKVKRLEGEMEKKVYGYEVFAKILEENAKKNQERILELEKALEPAQKAEGQLKEFQGKIKQLEENEARHKERIQAMEEEAKQAQEKIQRLENVLESTATSHNKADAEAAHTWENNYNQAQKELCQKTKECLALERDKEQLRNEMKALGLQFQAGPKREQRMKDTITRMDNELFALKQKLEAQGGGRIQQLEKMVEDAQRRVTELEVRNREQVEQIDGLERQSNESHKVMIFQMKRANKQKKYYDDEKLEKEKMKELLKKRHRKAEEDEKELKERISNLEKELEAVKAEKNAETSKLDVTLKEKADEQDEAARRRIKELELVARIDFLRSDLEKEKEKTTAFFSELELIKKERDELKQGNGNVSHLEKELEEKREELRKTEAIFEQMEKTCEEKTKKIERLTKSMQTMEATRKQREDMWNVAVGDHKKQLEETENEKARAVAEVTAKLTTMIKERDNEARERGNLLKRQQSLDQKAADLEKERREAVLLADKEKQEKEELVKKHQEELEQLKREHMAEKTELGKKVQAFKESTIKSAQELSGKMTRKEEELQEIKEKAAQNLEENEKLTRELARQREIFIDLRKNIGRAFTSQ